MSTWDIGLAGALKSAPVPVLGDVALHVRALLLWPPQAKSDLRHPSWGKTFGPLAGRAENDPELRMKDVGKMRRVRVRICGFFPSHCNATRSAAVHGGTK